MRPYGRQKTRDETEGHPSGIEAGRISGRNQRLHKVLVKGYPNPFHQPCFGAAGGVVIRSLKAARCGGVLRYQLCDSCLCFSNDRNQLNHLCFATNSNECTRYEVHQSRQWYCLPLKPGRIYGNLRRGKPAS